MASLDLPMSRHTSPKSVFQPTIVANWSSPTTADETDVKNPNGIRYSSLTTVFIALGTKPLNHLAVAIKLHKPARVVCDF